MRNAAKFGGVKSVECIIYVLFLSWDPGPPVSIYQ